MSSKKKILIVNSWENFATPIIATFPDFEVVSATTAEEGKNAFELHKDSIALVVVGTLVNVGMGQPPLSLPLVRHIKEVSSIPVVGMTIISKFEAMFREAGCDDVCAQQKLCVTVGRYLGT